MRSLRFAVVLLLVASSLEAATIYSISPMKLWLHEGESWLTIDGTGFTAPCAVTISGPAGTFTVTPNSSSSTRLIVWVPIEVTSVAGQYSVTACGSNNVRLDVVDMTGPVLHLPPTTIVAEGTSKAGAVVTYEVRAYSARDGHPVSVTCNPASGSTFAFGTSTVKCMATDDGSGGMSSGEFKIKVTDTTRPQLQVPQDMVFEANRPDGTRVVEYVVTASDNIDGPLTPWCDTPSGTAFLSGITQVVCWAIDAHMNATSGKFNVTIVNQSAGPILHLPADITVEANHSENGSVVHFTVTASPGGPDENQRPGDVTCTPASGSLFPIGTTTVQCSVSDAAGHTTTGSFNVTVKRTDTTPPVLHLPDDIFTTDPVVMYTATAIDAVEGHVPIMCIPMSGSTFPNGVTTVQCSASDSSGNTATGSFKVTVSEPTDTTPPLLTLPDDITTTERVVNYTAYATDQRDGPVPITCNPPSGSTFPIGMTTVQCSASDSSGNTATGSFKVTVNQAPDTTPPVLSLPADITTTERVVTYTATATDNVDGSVPVTCNPPSGSTFPIGMTTVQCSASDGSGNTANGSFKVTVQDNTPPVLTLPADITTTERVVTYTATANDDVDGPVPVTCTPPSGSRFPKGTTTVQCSASDGSGNTANGSFQVTVTDKPDKTAPVLTLPSDITTTERYVTFEATATDDVDGPVPVTCTPASGSRFELGTTTVQCSASDSSGNTANGSFNVTVNQAPDTTPPVLTLPADLTVSATNADGEIVTFAASANDAVDGNVPVSCAPPSGSRFPLGTTVVQCSASDSSQNTATGAFSVHVVDDTPPEIVRITATPNVLWPANHKLVDIRITVEAVDAVDSAPRSRVYTVSANEPIDAPGSGDTEYDWEIREPLLVAVRAERSGELQDRIYTLFIECVDASGNPAVGTVTVTVPHEQPRSGDATVPKRRRSARH